jgi:hypothetical protein
MGHQQNANPDSKAGWSESQLLLTKVADLHFLSVLLIGKPNKHGTPGGVVGCCGRERFGHLQTRSGRSRVRVPLRAVCSFFFFCRLFFPSSAFAKRLL